jgi:hypothetical protein
MHGNAVLIISICGLTCVAGAGLAQAEEGKKAEDGKKKVTLCHRPPGNPKNAHTISVGEPATAAHLRHGDQLGPCPSEDAITSRTPANSDAPARGPRDRSPAGPPRKADASPPPP